MEPERAAASDGGLARRPAILDAVLGWVDRHDEAPTSVLIQELMYLVETCTDEVLLKLYSLAHEALRESGDGRHLQAALGSLEALGSAADGLPAREAERAREVSHLARRTASLGAELASRRAGARLAELEARAARARAEATALLARGDAVGAAAALARTGGVPEGPQGKLRACVVAALRAQVLAAAGVPPARGAASPSPTPSASSASSKGSTSSLEAHAGACVGDGVPAHSPPGPPSSLWAALASLGSDEDTITALAATTLEKLLLPALAAGAGEVAAPGGRGSVAGVGGEVTRDSAAGGSGEGARGGAGGSDGEREAAGEPEAPGRAPSPASSASSTPASVERAVLRTLRQVTRGALGSDPTLCARLGAVLWPSFARAYARARLRPLAPSSATALAAWQRASSRALRMEAQARELGLLAAGRPDEPGAAAGAAAAAPVRRACETTTDRFLRGWREDLTRAARAAISAIDPRETIQVAFPPEPCAEASAETAGAEARAPPAPRAATPRSRGPGTPAPGPSTAPGPRASDAWGDEWNDEGWDFDEDDLELDGEAPPAPSEPSGGAGAPARDAQGRDDAPAGPPAPTVEVSRGAANLAALLSSAISEACASGSPALARAACVVVVEAAAALAAAPWWAPPETRRAATAEGGPASGRSPAPGPAVPPAPAATAPPPPRPPSAPLSGGRSTPSAPFAGALSRLAGTTAERFSDRIQERLSSHLASALEGARGGLAARARQAAEAVGEAGVFGAGDEAAAPASARPGPGRPAPPAELGPLTAGPYATALWHNDCELVSATLRALPEANRPRLQQLVHKAVSFTNPAAAVARSGRLALEAAVRSAEREVSEALDGVGLWGRVGAAGPGSLGSRRSVQRALGALRRVRGTLGAALPPREYIAVASRLADGACGRVVTGILSMRDISVEESETIPRVFADLAAGAASALAGDDGGADGAPARASGGGGAAPAEAGDDGGPAGLATAIETASLEILRLREVLDLLSIRLAEIRERWRAGRLRAAGIADAELAGLVCAVFEDTRLRREVLAELEDGAPAAPEWDLAADGGGAFDWR